MQQTEKYKLNLIEKTDTFSPDPLNENMEKVEAQFDAARAEAAAGDAAEAAARTAAVAALDERVTVLELHHFAAGSYTGNATGPGGSQFIELGFTPAAVIVCPAPSAQMLCVEGIIYEVLKIVPGGFMAQRSGNMHSNNSVNDKNITYYYFAVC